MRQIKFRAWQKRGKLMRSVQNISFSAEKITTGDQEYPNRESVLDFNEIVLMQFTGLTDKNGKEIYEGDIVQWGAGVKETVIFRAAKFCIEGIDGYSIPMLKKDCTDFEIIGNIYENPDLLKI